VESYAADVVVIGGGLAGIVTAIEALAAGRRVLLIERDEKQNFGGLAKESFGGLWFVDTPLQRRHRIRDNVGLALADWLSFAEFEDGDDWPRRWAEAYVNRCTEDVYRWLRDRGVSFMPMPLWVERGLHTPGNSVPRWHIVWGTGHELAAVLVRALLDHPRRDRLQVLFGHRVESLLRTGGRVSGCQGATEVDGRPFEARGDTVVLASGGINGDLDRVRRHWHAEWSRPPEVLLNGSHKYADGLLHDAAAKLGAAVTHLDWQWNYAAGVHHYQPRKPHHGLSLVPPKSALWLDWQGRRIGPMPLVTGFDTRDLVTQICRQQRQYSWQLLNWKIALKELAVSGAEFNPAYRDKKRLGVLSSLLFGNRWVVEELTGKCKDFVTAQSLEELVEGMNALVGDGSVELAAVREAVARYDGCIDRGVRFHNDEQLRRIGWVRRWPGDRWRTCRFQKIDDPRARPLIAIREFILSRKSMGGVLTDLACRVLDTAGQPIDGLYAVGETAGFGGGGMNGKRGLEGTFLGGCILTGRIAGKEVSK
jgi:hypothetical protein